METTQIHLNQRILNNMFLITTLTPCAPVELCRHDEPDQVSQFELNRDQQNEPRTFLPHDLKKLMLLVFVNQRHVLTFPIVLSVNEPQVVVILVEIGCHLGGKSQRINK